MVSMIDVDCWQAVAQAFSVIDHTKRPHDRSGDAFGELHVIFEVLGAGEIMVDEVEIRVWEPGQKIDLPVKPVLPPR